MKKKANHRHREQTLVGWWTGSSKSETQQYTQNGQATRKALPYSTENGTQCAVMNHSARVLRKQNAHVCVTESLCSVVEINTTM